MPPATSASDQMGDPTTQSAAQPILMDTMRATLSPQVPPIYSIAPPSVAPSIQNNTSTGAHAEWNPAAGYSMPSMFNTSATLLMHY